MYVKIEDTIPEEEEEDMLDTLIHNRYNKQLHRCVDLILCRFYSSLDSHYESLY